MSLVTNPRHVVKVYPAIQKVMPDGGKRIDWADEPRLVPGNVQPLASDNLNRTASTRDEYYGETLATTATLTTPPGVWDLVRASLPEELREGFPIDALVVFEPGRYVTVAGARTPTYSPPQVYQINARLVMFRMGWNTQHDKISLYRGNDVHRKFLEGKV